MSDPQISPLALTDDELGSLYKAVTAPDFRRGLRVVENPRIKRGGSAEPRYQLVLEGSRGENERTVAQFYKHQDAEAVARICTQAAFLIESLQTRDQELSAVTNELAWVQESFDALGVPKALPTGELYSLHGRVLALLQAERERAAHIARTGVGDGASESEVSIVMAIAEAILAPSSQTGECGA
jgi:hypothetical protein